MSRQKKHKKDESKEKVPEEDVINKRIYASVRLIKVDTTPPVYLHTSLIGKSPVFKTIAHLVTKDSVPEMNEYGDKCMICLPHENIPHETWKVLELLIDDKYTTESNLINNNTLDDLLYICFKYDLPFNIISDLEYSVRQHTKLLKVIIDICKQSCKQYFPKTGHIPKINEHYAEWGSVLFKVLKYEYHRYDDRLSFLTSLKMIQPLYDILLLVVAKVGIKLMTN